MSRGLMPVLQWLAVLPMLNSWSLARCQFYPFEIAGHWQDASSTHLKFRSLARCQFYRRER
ncbi:hypothetical protein [Moorena bouillonii]|uniref:hypothetical protein n=1 Tax=Moorena bouillonii TaxID=207920 RepID=UPI00117C4D9C|nr:hypothetical protein [Moorena bouillonii]